MRFQAKLDQINKSLEKKGDQNGEEPEKENKYSQDQEETTNLGIPKEEENIKFVSIIDQKPIIPSYLELVPMKDFSRKEQKAAKDQFKDTTKQESTENK